MQSCVSRCAVPQGPELFSVAYNFSTSTGVAFEAFEGHGYANVTGRGGTQLRLNHNVRGYAVADFRARKWEDVRYTKLQLLGRTLSWTADVSDVGCGCNAALYLVAMPAAGSAGSSGYCAPRPASLADLRATLYHAPLAATPMPVPCVVR